MKTRPTYFRLPYFLVLIALCIYSVSSIASERPAPSNGAVAKAYPISNITLDGDSSDWPSDLTAYPIAINYGDQLAATDFTASFKVGYNLAEGALYVLVEVTDDDHIVDSSENADWDTQDTWNFYLDPKHEIRGSGVHLFQYGMNFKDQSNSSENWDPEHHKLNWDHIEIRSSRKGTTTVYEGKALLGDYLKVGGIIGMDHVLIDKDKEDSTNSFIAWGHDTGKSNSPTRLGDVMILPNNAKLAALEGTISFDDASIPGMLKRVQITSKDDPSLWNMVRVDTLGNYQAELPEGNYEVKPYWAFYNYQGKSLRIDPKKSSVAVSLKSDQVQTAKNLVVHSIPNPELLPEKGIMLQPDADVKKQVDEFITTYQEFLEIPGVSLVIIKDGKVFYEKTYGVKNNYTQQPVDQNTLFEAASISKPVFAFAVCRLAERGIIDLDKPLYESLPFDDIAHDDRYKLITARHVLTHKTGFPNWARMGPEGKINIKFTPGEGYGYSGEGFEYLKRVVAEITGKDTNTTLKEEVFEPLNIQNTFFSHNEYLAKVASHGHFGRHPSRAELPSEPGVAWSMHTNAKEFTAFALGLLERRGMKAETYQKMFTVETDITEDEDYPFPDGFTYHFGLGIAIEKTPLGMAFGHGGNNGDFKCEFKMYEALRSGYIVFTNSDNGDALHNHLNQLLFTGKLPDPESKQ